MSTIDYKKISVYHLYEMFYILSPMRSERRLMFQKYNSFLIENDLISETDVDNYSSTDYIKDFEKFEKSKNNGNKELVSNIIIKSVLLYAVYNTMSLIFS